MEAQAQTTNIEIGKLSAKARTSGGKGTARKLRASGLIPAIVYGGGEAPVAIALDPVRLERALDPERMRNTVFDLTVEAADGSTILAKAMLKDYQIDALSQVLTHVDFIRVDVSKPIRVNVPLKIMGRSEGEKIGGVLHQVFRVLPIDALPAAIPPYIEGDVTALNIGDSIDVHDLKVVEGVKIALPDKQTVAQCVAPRAIVEETVEGEEGELEEGEGEAAAEGEGDKKAEGDKG